MPPAPIHAEPPHCQLHSLRGTFVTTDEPMNHNHLKFIADVTVHYGCCTSCRFGQIYNDMHLSLWYHTVFFTALKILWAPLIHPSAFPSVLPVFASLTTQSLRSYYGLSMECIMLLLVLFNFGFCQCQLLEPGFFFLIFKSLL